MSKSFAGFHLNVGAKRLMHTSVDKLFEEGESVETAEESTVAKLKPSAISSQPVNAQTIPHAVQGLFGANLKQQADTSSVPSLQMEDVPAPVGRSSTNVGSEDRSARESSSDLYRQYQRQRQRVEEELAQREKQRQIYKQQILEADEFCHIRDSSDDVKTSVQNLEDRKKGKFFVTLA